MKGFSEKVKEQRARLGLSQKELAKRPELDTGRLQPMKPGIAFQEQLLCISWQKPWKYLRNI